MHLLQATWDVNAGLLFWAECGSASSAAEEQEPGAKRRHPAVCTAQEVTSALEDLGFSASPAGEIEVFLPTAAGLPLRSPRLRLTEEKEPEEAARLEGWLIPAVSLDPVQAVSFLVSLPQHLTPPFRADDSVAYWREPCKLLLELLTRGRFIPGIARKGRSWHSFWHVLPGTDEDRARLAAIAESMPPICRAVRQRGFARTPQPRNLLESFITVCGDSLIRSFLRQDELLEEDIYPSLPPRQLVPAGWARSLTSADSKLASLDYDLIKFEQRLRLWAGKLLSTDADHRVRTAFRLLSPSSETPDAPWRIEFVLQSETAPELELTAEQFWRGESGFLQQTDLSEEEVEEMLLRDLGRASEAYPRILSALQELHPACAVLSLEEAYSFLKDDSKRLEQHGFPVILPSWWSQPATQLGLRLRVDSPPLSGTREGTGFLAGRRINDYSWEVALGDAAISMEEFRRLVAAKMPLLPVGGRWIEINPKKLNATLRFLEEQEGETKPLRFIDVLRIGLGVDHHPDLLPITSFTTSGWIERLLQRDAYSLSPLAEPPGFAGELRKYQREGLAWLALLAAAGVGGCLADDMGLGKTVQALALLLLERNSAENSPVIGPTLLIVPMSILTNWLYETRRFAPSLRAYTHHGQDRLTGAAFRQACSEHDLVITTYSLANRDEDLFAQIQWGRIILDEAQNIKNVDAKQTKAIKRLAQPPLERGDAWCQRLALTGTPLENRLQELWSIFDFLNPGYLGTFQEFRTRFAQPIESLRSKNAAALLNQMVRPFMLRRLKADPAVISDLPEKIEMEVFTTLTEEQAALYQAVLDNVFPQIESATGIHRKGLVLSAITRLKQICDHPALILKDGQPPAERSGKLALLEELLEVLLAEGDRALIFTQFAQMGHLLHGYLQERLDTEVLFLHGSLSKNARENLVAKFRKPEGPRIFVLSLKAGGLGLNLTEANQVIHFDQWWNPAVQDQATDRAYRIGQTRTVQVRKFICKGTLEEKINEMLFFKRSLVDQIVGSTRNAILDLSTEELRGLLQLTTEHLGRKEPE